MYACRRAGLDIFAQVPHGSWSVRCGPHSRPADPVAKLPEVSCCRECNLRNADDEALTIRRLKCWALSYIYNDTKAKHQRHMKAYPSDETLFDAEELRLFLGST